MAILYFTKGPPSMSEPLKEEGGSNIKSEPCMYYVKCLDCSHEWNAFFPEGWFSRRNKIECPQERKMVNVSCMDENGRYPCSA